MIAVDTSNLDILYIEDSSIDGVLMELIAKKSNCNQLQTVMTAELGLALASTQQPKLILMDLYLPGMDGLEATRRLKQNAATRDIPVIAVSSDNTGGTAVRVREAGCAEFFSKPLDVTRVIATINHYLGQGAAAQNPVEQKSPG